MTIFAQPLNIKPEFFRIAFPVMSFDESSIRALLTCFRSNENTTPQSRTHEPSSPENLLPVPVRDEPRPLRCYLVKRESAQSGPTVGSNDRLSRRGEFKPMNRCTVKFAHRRWAIKEHLGHETIQTTTCFYRGFEIDIVWLLFEIFLSLDRSCGRLS